MKTLADLALGQQATVSEVQGVDEVSVRLMEMGLTPGVKVSLIGVAPLGDPLEFEVRGYNLSLRKTEAAKVCIQPQ